MLGSIVTISAVSSFFWMTLLISSILRPFNSIATSAISKSFLNFSFISCLYSFLMKFFLVQDGIYNSQTANGLELMQIKISGFSSRM